MDRLVESPSHPPARRWRFKAARPVTPAMRFAACALRKLSGALSYGTPTAGTFVPDLSRWRPTCPHLGQFSRTARSNSPILVLLLPATVAVQFRSWRTRLPLHGRRKIKSPSLHCHSIPRRTRWSTVGNVGVPHPPRPTKSRLMRSPNALYFCPASRYCRE